MVLNYSQKTSLTNSLLFFCLLLPTLKFFLFLFICFYDLLGFMFVLDTFLLHMALGLFFHWLDNY